MSGEKIFYYWGKEKPSQFDPAWGQTASRMYQQGDKVVISSEQYDHEDNRLYEYEGVFALADYKRAFNKFRSTGNPVTVAGVDGAELTISRDGRRIKLSLSCSASGPPSLCGAICSYSEIKLRKIRPRSSFSLSAFFGGT